MTKRGIIVTLFIICVASMLLAGFVFDRLHHTYALSGIVTKVNAENNTVVFEDFNGNLWEFTGTEDWQVNDIIATIMDDNGTIEIYDDIILSTTYNGYI